MRIRVLTAALAVCALNHAAQAAKNIDRVNQITQADFRDLSGDLGATVSYKAVIPAEPLGVTGFDIGAEVTATTLAHRDAWDRASSGSAPNTLYVPKVHLHKGLPAGFDLGVSYATAPETNINVWGAEVRYALVPGGVATPAVAVRGTYSKLSGVDQIDLNTKGIELAISKGFAFFTPYAGVGHVWTESTPVGVATLQREKISDGKYFVGANINFLVGNLVLEGDKTGDVTSYSVKLGFRF
jgi:hypothetical protein